MDTPREIPMPETDGTITCPHCGQMLAANCRVCVSCKQAIDPGALRPPEPAAPSAAVCEPGLATPIARFSWPIFFITLAAFFIASDVAAVVLGLAMAQLIVFGLVIGSSFWVLWDAQTKRIPRAWRWGAACILLWAVFFPWYLSRRRTPRAACPFMEGGKSSLLRLLVGLLLMILLGAVIAMIVGPSAHP